MSIILVHYAIHGAWRYFFARASSRLISRLVLQVLRRALHEPDVGFERRHIRWLRACFTIFYSLFTGQVFIFVLFIVAFIIYLDGYLSRLHSRRYLSSSFGLSPDDA